MSYPTFTDNAPGESDCIVWTEGNPSTIWASSTHQTSASKSDDKVKMQVLGYYSSILSPIEEDLPPKYNSQYRKSQAHISHSLLHAIRFILLDHLLLKVLAVYLLMIYTTGTTSLLSPLGLSDWANNEERLLRSHSRDFLSVDFYELYEDTDAWSRSRLGRVGSASPLLTYSEMQLVGQVEWEVEPEVIVDDTLAHNAPEEQAPLPPKTQKRLPLPFHRPSNVFNPSRHVDQGKRVNTETQ